MGVERLARNPGLHHRIEILGMHCQHLVHARHIQRDAAVDRQDMAFQRSAGAVGNHREFVPGAGLDHRCHFLGGCGKHHRVGQGIREMRFVMTVMLAHSGGNRHPFGTQCGLEIIQQSGG